MPPGWTATSGADLVTVAEDGSGNRYMAATETANSTANTASLAFAEPLSASFVVDMRVLAKQTNAEGYFLTLRDGAGAKVLELLFDGSRISRRLPDNGKSALQTISANTWYAVQASIDMDARTYSVSIDGTTVATDIPLLTETGEVSAMTFSTYRFQKGTFFADDIHISADGGTEPVNHAPEAVDVGIAGTAEPGQTLTGQYTYQDDEADAEGASVYQWYRAGQADGSGAEAIAGASALTYTVAPEDAGMYLLFGVTPAAASGTAQGAAVRSAPVQVAGEPDTDNAAPTADGVAIQGVAEAGQTLTGAYAYHDEDSDAESGSVFQWYRAGLADGSDKTPIAGATALTYSVGAADEGHYLLFEVTPAAAAGASPGLPVLSQPVYVAPADVTVEGNEAAFGTDGAFTDGMDNLSHLFGYRGIQASGGSVKGINGDLFYHTPDADISRISLDVIYNKWTLNFDAPDELEAYAVSYDSSTGMFANGGKITLVRQLRPDLMANVQYVKATYTSASIDPGTRYIRIMLPRTGYFGSAATAADFAVDAVKLENADAAMPIADGYLVDDAADFSKFAEGTDTANLQAAALNPATDISLIRTFGTTSYFKRLNSTAASTEMTYAAPEGKDFKTAYVEGYYYQSLPANPFEIWTSADGATFTKFNTAGIYLHPAFGSSTNNSIPDVLRANYLPDGVKYIQVRLPAVGSGGFPYMTKLAFGYGEEVPAEPVDADLTIKQATADIALDGVIETDADGHPTGEWAGSETLHIAGVTDNDGNRHGADLFMKYDPEMLYIGAKVKDPTPMKNIRTGTGIWNGDAIELFMGDEDLDGTANPEAAGTMLPSDRQLVLGSGVDYGYQSYLNWNGVNSFPSVFMEIKKDADGKGYVMEAAIPLEALGIANPWEGKALIMNAVLNDGDFASRGQWGWTTVGEPTKKARGLWGSAVFEQTAAPEQEMELSASVDNATQLVTVTGRTLYTAGGFVGMTVTGPDGTPSQIDQTVSDGNGSFTFQYTLHTDASGNGTYTVSVGGEGVRMPQTASFTFAYEDPPVSAPSGDATLAGLAVEGGVMVPGFSADKRIYLALVDKTSDTITLDAAANDSRYSRIAVNGTELTSGVPLELPLDKKLGVYVVEVTAQDGIAKETYAVIAVKTNQKKLNVLTELLCERYLEKYERQAKQLAAMADQLYRELGAFIRFE